MADPDIVLCADHDKSNYYYPAVVPIAVGRPVEAFANAFVFSTSNVITHNAIQALQQQGFPLGLAQEMGNTRASHPIRFWIVDNSGSMRSSDGHEVRGSNKQSLMVVPCTRWKELQGAIEYHAELAGLIGANTIFRMLNDPGATVGPQEFTVASDADSTSSIEQDVAQAVRIIQQAEPEGGTPLTEHLTVIRERIRAMAPTLQSQGQKAVVVLATDGLPSDETGRSNERVTSEFIDALRSLQRLPVWIVVRLCTDESSVVAFYNDLDSILELPLEVIDDYIGEGDEIHQANKWLNYTLPLHRCREMGYQHRIFDLLDERLLNKDELREFLTLLFGEAALRNAPDVHSNWKGFSAAVAHIVKNEGKEWNSQTKKLSPWIDMKELNRQYGKRRGLFGLGRKK